MKQRLLLTVIFSLVVVAQGGAAHAFHPLITDDTSTYPKGRWKAKLVGSYEHDDNERRELSVTKITPALVYGITDTMDIDVGQPYRFTRKVANGLVTESDGIADTEIRLKWRFYDRDGLSFALRPSLTLPTGDEKKGLGKGKATGTLFLFATKKIAPLAVHFNMGYERNENKADARVDLYHFSAAAEYEAVKGFKLVGEVGIDRNIDKSSNTHPVYTTVGVIYLPAKNIVLDLGLRVGLNEVAPDYAILPGIVIKF
jgi:hypothetical protein